MSIDMRREAFLISAPLLGGAIIMAWFAINAPSEIRGWPTLYGLTYWVGWVGINLYAWLDR